MNDLQKDEVDKYRRVAFDMRVLTSEDLQRSVKVMGKGHFDF
jgi:hypothetical protein